MIGALGLRRLEKQKLNPKMRELGGQRVLNKYLTNTTHWAGGSPLRSLHVYAMELNVLRSGAP